MEAARLRDPGQHAQSVVWVFRAAQEDALEAQQRLGDAPTCVEFTHQVGGRHAHVFQEHFAQLAVPRHVPDRPHPDAGLVHVDQEEADAGLLLRLLVGARQHEDVAGVGGERGPDLLAVDDVLVAIGDRLGTQPRQVRARIRFGVPLAPQVLASDDLRQPLVALLGRAVADQQRADHQDAHVGKARDAPALVLLVEDQQLGRVKAHAAVLARPVRRDPAKLGHLAVPEPDFLPEQAPRGIAQFVRVVGLEEVADAPAKILIGQRVPVDGVVGFHASAASKGGAWRA